MNPDQKLRLAIVLVVLAAGIGGGLSGFAIGHTTTPTVTAALQNTITTTSWATVAQSSTLTSISTVTVATTQPLNYGNYGNYGYGYCPYGDPLCSGPGAYPYLTNHYQTIYGYLPANQSNCPHLYGDDGRTYLLINLPSSYPTGHVAVYGYLTGPLANFCGGKGLNVITIQPA